MTDSGRIEVRRASLDDAALLRTLYARFLESQFALMPTVPRNPDFDLDRLIRFRLSDPSTTVFVATVDGRAAGFSDVVLRYTDAAPPRSLLARFRRAAAVLAGRHVHVYVGFQRVAHLLNLWVEPEFRGLKLGERLTTCRVDLARAAGAEFIFGEVLADNEPSHRTVTATGAKAWATIYRWPSQPS